MIVSRQVTVAWTLDGYHRWPDASGERSYLADRHRHRFGFAVTVPVNHAERDIEFHDLMDECRRYQSARAGVIDFGALSCEAIAEDLAGHVARTFGVPWVEVAVDEDNYVTGMVRWEEKA